MMRTATGIVAALAVLTLAQMLWHVACDPVFPDPRIPVLDLPWLLLREVPFTLGFAFLAAGLWVWGPPLLGLAAVTILAAAVARRFTGPAILIGLLILQAAGFQAGMISAGV